MPFLKSGCKGTNKLTIIKWQLTIIQNFNIFYAQESLHILTFCDKACQLLPISDTCVACLRPVVRWARLPYGRPDW